MQCEVLVDVVEATDDACDIRVGRGKLHASLGHAHQLDGLCVHCALHEWTDLEMLVHMHVVLKLPLMHRTERRAKQPFLQYITPAYTIVAHRWLQQSNSNTTIVIRDTRNNAVTYNLRKLHYTYPVHSKAGKLTLAQFFHHICIYALESNNYG